MFSLILVEPHVRRSHIYGLPPEFPPTMEEIQGVTMDQPVTTDPSMEGVSVVKSAEKYSSLENPFASTLVVSQLPPSHDSTFHFHTEGHYGA